VEGACREQWKKVKKKIKMEAGGWGLAALKLLVYIYKTPMPVPSHRCGVGRGVRVQKEGQLSCS